MAFDLSVPVHFHQNDLPSDIDFGNEIAADCEMMGLNTKRDRLCLVQLRGRDTDIHLVQIAKGQTEAPVLKKLLENRGTTKIFHFARADLATLKEWLSIDCQPVFCTYLASRLIRTYTESHGLKANCRQFLGVELQKQQQTSNWGAEQLSEDQLSYAAQDVLHLHDLKDHLTQLLKREERFDLARKCFEFLPTRAELDLAGWPEIDILAHT